MPIDESLLSEPMNHYGSDPWANIEEEVKHVSNGDLSKYSHLRVTADGEESTEVDNDALGPLSSGAGVDPDNES